MLGKAAIKQGWYWGWWWHPTAQGELGSPQSLSEEREEPLGAGVPSGRVPQT